MARNGKLAEDNIVNSIIGEGSDFKGEFKINGLLRIDGHFQGTIETDGKVLIGQTGEAVTDIKARLVVVGGNVRGNIFATERVIFLSTGVINGNIITPSLIMEEGVQFEGNCTINKRPDEMHHDRNNRGQGQKRREGKDHQEGQALLGQAGRQDLLLRAAENHGRRVRGPHRQADAGPEGPGKALP